MSEEYRSNLKGKKCKNCRKNECEKCVAWTCGCVNCVDSVEKQREKTLRLTDYYTNNQGGKKFNRHGRAYKPDVDSGWCGYKSEQDSSNDDY